MRLIKLLFPKEFDSWKRMRDDLEFRILEREKMIVRMKQSINSLQEESAAIRASLFEENQKELARKRRNYRQRESMRKLRAERMAAEKKGPIDKPRTIGPKRQTKQKQTSVVQK